MKKNIAIIGLGRFGLKLVECLSKLDVEIIAIDNDVKAVSKASDFTSNVVVCDSTNESSLKEAGLKNIDHAIVAFGQDLPINLSKTIITTLILSSMNIKEITVRLDDNKYQPVLKKMGATDFISPLQLASERLANKVAAINFIDYFNVSNEYNVVEIRVNSEFKSLSIAELDTPKKFDTNIILIKRINDLFMPKGTDNILPNDIIFSFGTMEGIRKLDSYLNKSRK
jgi:trk system potassium uptake protein TrkA